MLGADRRPVQAQQPSSLEHTIDDDLGEVVVVQHLAPALRVLVRREDHRAPLDVTLVDDVEEHVGGVVAVREVADLVDDEHVRFEVARERFAKPTVTTRARGSSMSSAQFTKSPSKPLCIARYAREIARCVLPRPVLPTSSPSGPR